MVNGILLFALLFICIVTDIRERRIYNKVLFPVLLLAFIVNGFSDGPGGLAATGLGMLLGLGILLIPYLMGGMGAGDVKLLAVIGALMGPGFVLHTAIYMALAGGVFALLFILFRKGAKARLLAMAFFIGGLFSGIKAPLIRDNGAMKATYPYGVAIAAGAAIQFFRGGSLL